MSEERFLGMFIYEYFCCAQLHQSLARSHQYTPVCSASFVLRIHSKPANVDNHMCSFAGFIISLEIGTYGDGLHKHACISTKIVHVRLHTITSQHYLSLFTNEEYIWTDTSQILGDRHVEDDHMRHLSVKHQNHINWGKSGLCSHQDDSGSNSFEAKCYTKKITKLLTNETTAFPSIT